MEVILMESVDNLGEMGQTVNVSPGFARNFLIPKKLAVPSTAGHAKLVAQHMKLAAKQEDLRKAGALELAAKLGDLGCIIAVQADEDEKLFGSVTARDIAEQLKSAHTTFEHRQIILEEAIKQLGVYDVPVKLHSEVSVTAKVQVVKA
jgi:large subunit ribosomal protein L9